MTAGALCGLQRCRVSTHCRDGHAPCSSKKRVLSCRLELPTGHLEGSSPHGCRCRDREDHSAPIDLLSCILEGYNPVFDCNCYSSRSKIIPPFKGMPRFMPLH